MFVKSFADEGLSRLKCTNVVRTIPVFIWTHPTGESVAQHLFSMRFSFVCEI